MNVGKFNLKKLNYVEVKGQCQIKVSNGFAAFKTLMIIWASVGLGEILKRM
jgi:hypothetical protein